MATKFMRGNSWYIGYHCRIKGYRVTESIGRVTEEQAERARKIKELELATGVEISSEQIDEISKKGAIKFATFWQEQYMPWHRAQNPGSQRKMTSISRRLLADFGEMRLRDITLRAIEDWKTRRSTETFVRGKGENRQVIPISQATVRSEFSQLQAALSRAVLRGELDVSPIKPRSIQFRKADDDIPHRIPPHEMQAIYEKAGKRAPWWALIANTGMRRKEAQNLEWSDVRPAPDGRLVGGTIVIASRGSLGRRNKTGRMRTVPINQAAAEALASLQELTGGGQFVYPRLNSRTFSRYFEQAAAKAGVEASLHDLRHTFGAALAAAGVPVVVIKDLMGHQSITMTQRYIIGYAPHHQASAVASISL